jgi:hypothetical protein
VSINQEIPVRRIGTPTNPRETQRTISKVGHGVLQECADARFSFARDLVFGEGDAGFVAAGSDLEVRVSGMLVADLQFAPLGIWFHEESALDVEEDGQVLV